jgi:hypothetical protein
MLDPEKTKSSVIVEFLGIPRNRAGVSSCLVPTGSLSSIIDHLKIKYPRLSEHLDVGIKGKGHVLYSLNGDKFLSDPGFELVNGQRLLVISADAGG